MCSQETQVIGKLAAVGRDRVQLRCDKSRSSDAQDYDAWCVAKRRMMACAGQSKSAEFDSSRRKRGLRPHFERRGKNLGPREKGCGGLEGGLVPKMRVQMTRPLRATTATATVAARERERPES